MSAIASFYLVRHVDIDRLKDLATLPVGIAAGGTWHDPYWAFLLANARELEPYQWSGDAMLAVSHYLDSRSVGLEAYCDKPLTDFLCSARRSSILAFQAEPGKTLTRLIETNLPDEKSLEAYLASPDMLDPDGDTPPREALMDGVRILTIWLSQLDVEHVGLMTVG